MVDARDLKSLGPSGCAGSIPAPGTITVKGLAILAGPFLALKLSIIAFFVTIQVIRFKIQSSRLGEFMVT